MYSYFLLKLLLVFYKIPENMKIILIKISVVVVFTIETLENIFCISLIWSFVSYK